MFVDTKMFSPPHLPPLPPPLPSPPLLPLPLPLYSKCTVMGLATKPTPYYEHKLCMGK